MANTVWMNLKIDPKDKDIIKTAADLDDRNISNFVRRAALKEARALIKKEGSRK